MIRPSPGTALAVVPVALDTSDPGSAVPATTPSGRIYDSLARVRAIRRDILNFRPATDSGDYHGSA